MSWLNRGKSFKLLFVTSSGREYMVTLVRTMGLMEDEPPFVAYEQPDDVVTCGDPELRFSSIHSLANHFGCVVGDTTSVDPAN